jgi:hypothetical protein
MQSGMSGQEALLRGGAVYPTDEACYTRSAGGSDVARLPGTILCD